MSGQLVVFDWLLPRNPRMKKERRDLIGCWSRAFFSALILSFLHGGARSLLM